MKQFGRWTGRGGGTLRLHHKHIEEFMKYKMVVKTGDKIFVKAKSKNKEHLENRAIALTKKKPYMTVYVVSEDTRI